MSKGGGTILSYSPPRGQGLQKTKAAKKISHVESKPTLANSHSSKSVSARYKNVQSRVKNQIDQAKRIYKEEQEKSSRHQPPNRYTKEPEVYYK